MRGFTKSLFSSMENDLKNKSLDELKQELTSKDNKKKTAHGKEEEASAFIPLLMATGLGSAEAAQLAPKASAAATGALSIPAGSAGSNILSAIGPVGAAIGIAFALKGTIDSIGNIVDATIDYFDKKKIKSNWSNADKTELKSLMKQAMPAVESILPISGNMLMDYGLDDFPEWAKEAEDTATAEANDLVGTGGKPPQKNDDDDDDDDKWQKIQDIIRDIKDGIDNSLIKAKINNLGLNNDPALHRLVKSAILTKEAVAFDNWASNGMNQIKLRNAYKSQNHPGEKLVEVDRHKAHLPAEKSEVNRRLFENYKNLDKKYENQRTHSQIDTYMSNQNSKRGGLTPEKADELTPYYKGFSSETGEHKLTTNNNTRDLAQSLAKKENVRTYYDNVLHENVNTRPVGPDDISKLSKSLDTSGMTGEELIEFQKKLAEAMGKVSFD